MAGDWFDNAGNGAALDVAAGDANARCAELDRSRRRHTTWRYVGRGTVHVLRVLRAANGSVVDGTAVRRAQRHRDAVLRTYPLEEREELRPGQRDVAVRTRELVLVEVCAAHCHGRIVRAVCCFQRRRRTTSGTSSTSTCSTASAALR